MVVKLKKTVYHPLREDRLSILRELAEFVVQKLSIRDNIRKLFNQLLGVTGRPAALVLTLEHSEGVR
jgi:hypothetical protein